MMPMATSNAERANVDEPAATSNHNDNNSVTAGNANGRMIVGLEDAVDAEELGEFFNTDTSSSGIDIDAAEQAEAEFRKTETSLKKHNSRLRRVHEGR